MWLLPHDPDGTCSNGRRHGSVPELRTNGHFTLACTRRSASAALVSSTCGRAAPCPSTRLASSTTIPLDGRNARDRHAGLWSQRRAESQHGTASKARSGPAAPEHDDECSCRPDTLVFASGITSSYAEFSFARYAFRALGKWTAQSVTLHSWCASFAEHGAAGRHWRNAWNAGQPARLVTARQRCFPRTLIPGHTTAPFCRRPLSQSGRPPRA
jgi:hypothetical protein